MENPSYVALSLQSSLQRRMEVVANNLANISTPGFHANRLAFTTLVSEKAMDKSLSGAGAKVSFVEEFGTYADTRPGPLTETRNPLDLAINGKGYFVVDTPEGQRYTRGGNFQLSADGRVITSEGYALLDKNQRPITIPAQAGKIEITREGQVQTEQGQVGSIQVVQFADELALRREAGGLYVANAAAQPADKTIEVRQGMLEGSNVEGVTEITRMLETLRAYQSAQRLVDNDQDRVRRAIDKLSRVG